MRLYVKHKQAKGQNEGTYQNHSEHTPLAVSAFKVGMAMVSWR